MQKSNNLIRRKQMSNANEPQQITVEQALFIKGKAFFTAMDEFRATLIQAEQSLFLQREKDMKAKIEDLESTSNKKTKDANKDAIIDQ